MAEQRNIFFVSGMPRSGSTLLCNILAQNPKIHATATSGIIEILFSVRNRWTSVTEFVAIPEDLKPENEKAKTRVLKSILEAYFANIEKPLIADKSRGWLSEIEMLETILDRKVKVLVPVRDVRDILASFEKLYRKTKSLKQVSQEHQFYHAFQHLQGRCQILLRGDQLVGVAFNRVKDALYRGFADRMHFIEYHELTSMPKTVLKDIYKFLDEEPFEHNFDNVEQVTREDDTVHIWQDLHVIRPIVEPQEPQWLKLIGSQICQELNYHVKENYEFWKHLKIGV